MTLWYDSSMTASKVRKTITLDADLFEAYDAGGNLSSAVNDVLRSDYEAKVRNEALGQWLDELAEERGPVDEVAVAAAMDQL